MPVNKAGQHITPDRLAIATGSVALLGEFLMPLELLPACSLDSPVLWVGIVPMLCGLILEIAAVREMRRTGTATRPHGNRPHLVATGPVRWSRNPFYIGVLLTLAGLMLTLSLDWMVLAIPMLWLKRFEPWQCRENCTPL